MESSQKFEKRWIILGVMCIVLFIISIDNTVLNLALPSISNSFTASASQLQWVVDTYTLVFASLLITTGSIGDRYGRKRLLIIGLSLFGCGSLGAALSTSINVLIAFRAVLGIAGAMVMPSTLSILIHVFRDGHERAKAIAIWSSIFSIGAGIGPIVGGILINNFSWPSVFYLNIPIVIVGVTGGLIFVPESSDANTPKPDIAGVLLSIIGLFSLVYGTIRAGEEGWTSSEVLTSFALAVIFLAGFIWWENRSEHPMLPLEFFKNMSFTGANVGLTICAFAMMGAMYFFSQFFQSVQGYSPLLSALCMFPMTPAVFASTMASVRINHKMGTKFTMTIGLLLCGLALFIFFWTARVDSSYWYVFLVLIVLGSGVGLTMSPATSSIMNSLPPNRAGIGSAMNDTTRQLGGALGIAVLGALMNSSYRAGVTSLAGISGMSDATLETIRSSIQAAHMTAQQLGGQLSGLIIQASSQAFVDGMRLAFLIAGFAMILAAAAAWAILPDKRKIPSEKKDDLIEE